MDINIILEPDLSPAQFAEIAVEAERLGVRGIWSSNYHMHYDPFLLLAPAAAATSRILLGPLAVSPWEMHPLKMANAVLTLNEMSNGRAMIAVSGGGGPLGAMGWRSRPDAAWWPPLNPEKRTADPGQRVIGVRDCLEVLRQARSGDWAMRYEGQVFAILRPFGMPWAKQPGPLLYSCSTGPMMARLGGRLADGIQISDGTPDLIAELVTQVEVGLGRRDDAPEDFRIGNFWAWHIKNDVAASMYEARRELIWRGAIIGQEREEIAKCCHDESEVDLIIDNWEAFRVAFRNRSGNIEGLPEDLVNRLIAGMASAGGPDRIEQEIERYRAMAASGLTELDLRLFDNPMEGLKLIGEHVLPALRDA